MSTSTSLTQRTSSVNRSISSSRRVWKAIIRAAIQEDGSLWFPQRLTREHLDAERQTLGPYLFSAQYQNEHIAPEDRRFEPDWLQRFQGKVFAAEGYHSLALETLGRSKNVPVFITTTVDPAISDERNTRSDYTAIVTVATDPLGNWYILSARRFRGGANRVLDEIITEIRTHSPAIVGIESVAYQRALKEFLLDRLRGEDLIVSVKELMSTTGRSKRARIEGLVPRFANRQVYFSSTLGLELEREILSWSPSQELPHDDLIDALSFQEDIAQPASLQGQRIPSGDWHDLAPELRQKIRSQLKNASDREVMNDLRTGYE